MQLKTSDLIKKRSRSLDFINQSRIFFPILKSFYQNQTLILIQQLLHCIIFMLHSQQQVGVISAF